VEALPEVFSTKGISTALPTQVTASSRLPKLSRLDLVEDPVSYGVPLPVGGQVKPFGRRRLGLLGRIVFDQIYRVATG